MPTPLPYLTFDLIEDRILDWVSQKPLDCSLPSLFEESLVKNQTSRSALSGEPGLLKARRRVRKAIKSLNSRKSSKAQTACCPEHSMTDGHHLRHMDEALSAFLQLPITPVQELPTDILLEIIQCAVLMDSRSTSDQLKWCLVSKDVFACVEPILMEELDTHSCQISFHKDISPRHEKAGKYVQDLVVFGDNEYDQEEFVRLFSRLCNIIILELHSFKDSRFPLPHPTFPHLERLDAISPLSFGVVGNDSIVRPDFSAPIFRNLTHIYFTVSHSIQRMLDADWQWSLESMTRLLFIRLYVLLKEDNFGRFLPYFENHISRRFPRSLRGCLVCAEEGSSDMVDAFLAVDPRIVWAFRSDDLPDEDPSWEISRTRNRVFMYDIMRIDTEIMYDVWGEKMVEAIEKDRG